MPEEIAEPLKCEHCGYLLMDVLYFERGRFLLQSKTDQRCRDEILFRCPKCRNVVPGKDVKRVVKAAQFYF
jgi:hypothetical protein